MLNRINPAVRHFTRHYIEMVLAMAAGMAALAILGAPALQLIGSSSAEFERDAPAMMFTAMFVAMTAPMVAWMRYRGHAWRPSAEMAGSMLLPTVAALVLLATGAHTDYMSLMMIEHTAMFPAMLVAMLLRLEEYTGGHDAHGQTVAA
jgi:hypothetical protein